MAPPSVVVVQLGQCGNQCGAAFFDALANEYYDSSIKQPSVTNSFFREGRGGKATARGILVDMEPKVVAEAFKSSGRLWGYDPERQFSKQGGSGNNWAFGNRVHGPSVKDVVTDIVRKEVEECDRFGGYLFLQSLAGGTGSGLGAYITNTLKDELGPAGGFCVNQVVWPYDHGEVIVQNYNSLLTLSSLCEDSDAVVVVENDAVNNTCNRNMEISNPTFEDMNAVVGKQMASMWLPSRYSQDCAPHYSMSNVEVASDFIEHLCAHKSYRMLSMRAIPQLPPKNKPFTTFKWNNIMKRLHRMLVTDVSNDAELTWNDPKGGFGRGTNMCVANWVIARGLVADTVDGTEFADKRMYARWVTKSPLMVSHSLRQFDKMEKSATLISNSQSILRPMDKMVGRASTMFQSKAYLHQYEKYGIGVDDFAHVFASIEQIISDYRGLSLPP